MVECGERPASIADMKSTVWRTQAATPAGHVFTEMFVNFGKGIEKRTGGKLKLKVYPSAGLGYPLTNTISTVRDGLQQVGYVLGAFCHGECPIIDLMEIPGLIPGDLDLRWKIRQAINPYYEKILPAKYGQYHLGGAQCGPRILGTIRKKIVTIDDLKGMKIRSSGANETKISKLLGMAPVSITTPEVYSALSSGTIDGCWGADEWFDPAKFYEVLKYAFVCEINGHTLAMTVNKRAFDALPADAQTIVREEGAKVFEWYAQEVKPIIMGSREVCMGKGMDYTYITREDWKRVVELAKPIIDDNIKEGGPEAKKIISVIQSMVSEWEANK
jgi:TRAP-type C4-dicarboxylate transport system substrate-binding protein